MTQLEKDEMVEGVGTTAPTGNGNLTEIERQHQRRVLSKFDMFVMPQMSILVLFAYLDRTNIGNARVFGFEDDTGMSGTDFNNVSMFFYISYIIFETPWVMAVKRYGPGKIIAIAIVCWSAITIGTAFVKTYANVILCRVLLGFFEAGLFPALTFVISTIYPPECQGKRVAVLYISIALSGALGGLIAYGIQSMGKQHGIEAWRWLFLIEGLICLVIGALCWLSLPTSPNTAWFLNAEERSTMTIISARNNPFEETEKFSWKQVLLAVSDPMVWIASVSLFTSSFALFGFGTFLPTLLRGLDYTALEANYLSVPVYILASICTGVTTYVSDRLNRRAVCLIHSPLLVITGYAIAVGTASKAVGFFAMFLVGAGVYSFNTILLTWVSNNVQPDYKRSVAISVVISIGNCAGLVASQIYPIQDAPRYVKGNAISLGTECVALFGVGLIYLLLKYRTKAKAQLIAAGAETNGKEGDQSLEFDYIL